MSWTYIVLRNSKEPDEGRWSVHRGFEKAFLAIYVKEPTEPRARLFRKIGFDILSRIAVYEPAPEGMEVPEC